MSEMVPPNQVGSATDIYITLGCGCKIVFIRGSIDHSRLTAPCTEHVKIDPIEQIKLLRVAEQAYVDKYR